MYLLLVTVCDADGLSWYGDESIMGRLSMDKSTFFEARRNLIQNGMIAWREPIYQVLSLQKEEPR